MLSEEELEDRLGMQYGWEPLKVPRWPLLLPFAVWFIVIVLAIFVPVALSGCAQTEFTGTCVLRPIWVSDSGIAYVRAYCKETE